MREWVRQHSPIKENALKPGTAGAGLMKHSRDNLRRLESETGDPWLSSLKADLLKTVESGKDVADLITKVEAALYRAGSRQTTQGTAPTPTNQPAQDQPAAHSASVTPAQQHPSTLDIKFDAQLGRDASTIQSNKRLVRYQINPRANWGPLNRAS
jgi:tRNA (guanine26-N2/guanine27-N2)-dimethyltransferase